MPYTIDTRYSVAVLSVEGRFLGSIERAPLQRTIEALKATGRTRLVIDLAKTDFVDSTGIGVLVRGAETLRAAGGDVCLAGLQARVKHLFVISRLLGPMFDGYSTVDAALAHFAGPVASEPV